jgi:hypothetical protein
MLLATRWSHHAGKRQWSGPDTTSISRQLFDIVDGGYRLPLTTRCTSSTTKRMATVPMTVPTALNNGRRVTMPAAYPPRPRGDRCGEARTNTARTDFEHLDESIEAAMMQMDGPPAGLIAHFVRPERSGFLFWNVWRVPKLRRSARRGETSVAVGRSSRRGPGCRCFGARAAHLPRRAQRDSAPRRTRWRRRRFSCCKSTCSAV